MNEPKGPDRIVNDVYGIGEVHVYDVEMIPDQEGINAVMAWAAAKKAAEAEAAESAADDAKQNDPDHPAA